MNSVQFVSLFEAGLFGKDGAVGKHFPKNRRERPQQAGEKAKGQELSQWANDLSGKDPGAATTVEEPTAQAFASQLLHKGGAEGLVILSESIRKGFALATHLGTGVVDNNGQGGGYWRDDAERMPEDERGDPMLDGAPTLFIDFSGKKLATMSR